MSYALGGTLRGTLKSLLMVPLSFLLLAACSTRCPEWCHTLIRLAAMFQGAFGSACLVTGFLSEDCLAYCWQPTQLFEACFEACPHHQHVALLLMRDVVTWRQTTASGGVLLPVQGRMQLQRLRRSL